MSYLSYLTMDCELYKPRQDGGYNLLPIPQEMVDELKTEIEALGDFEVIDVRNGCEGSVNYDYYVARLLALSSKFPTILFSVYRTGEDNGDIEREYYLGGGVQSCMARIEFDEFDPEKISGGQPPQYEPQVEIDTSDFL